MRKLFSIITFVFIALTMPLAQAATLTFDNAGGGGDNDWSTASNWLTSVVPGTSDNALITADINTLSFGPASVYSADFTNGSAWNSYFPLIVATTATFDDTSHNGGTINGNVKFNTTYYSGTTAPSGGILTINGNRFWSGIINGTVYGSDNQAITNYVFNNNSYISDLSTINGNVTFNNTSFNRGAINGNAKFNTTYYSGTTAPSGGIFTINNGSWIGSVSGTVTGSDDQVITSYIFNNNRALEGTLVGDVTFNDTSSIFYGAIHGNAKFNTTWYSGTTAPSGGVLTVNGANYWTGSVSGTVTGSDNQAITSYIFNNTSSAGGSINGNVTFNGASYLVGAINGNAKFNTTYYSGTTAPSGGVFTINGTNYWFGSVSGTVTGSDNQAITSYVFNNSSYNDGTIHGNATFNDTSFDSDHIIGNAYFNTTAYSGTTAPSGGVFTINSNGYGGNVSGTVYGADNQAITMYVFNTNSLLDGTINGASIFNTASAIDFSGIANGNSTFNDDSANIGILNGNGTFNNTSYNLGTINGNVIFNGASYNGVTDNANSYPSTINGNVVFNSSANQSGTINAGNGTVSGNFSTVDGIIFKSGTVSSNISGTGGLSKTGTGTVTLNGASTYSGGTTISAGTLQVGNTNALGTGNVVNNATLDVGTTNASVGGVYTQGSGSTLKLTANSSSDYGKVSSTSAAVVNSGSSVYVNVGGYIPNNTTFKIIDTGAAGIGSVPTTITSSNSYLNFLASNSNGNLVLTANRDTNGFSSLTTNSNSGVGSVLDNVTNPTSDMTLVLNTLNNSSPTQTVAAVNSFTPDTSSSNSQATTQMSDQFIGAQSDHLGGVSDVALGDNIQETGMSAGDQPNPYSAWFKGFGGYAHQDPRGTSNGYNLTNSGGAVGFEKALSDILKAGIAVGNSESWIRSKDSAARTNINATQVSVYGGLKPLSIPWYLNGALTYAYNQYDGSRQIYISPTDNRIANASYHGDLYGVSFETGYGFKISKVVFTPIASLTYNHLHLGQYSENNAGALNLNVNTQDYDNLRGGLGGKLQLGKMFSFGTLTTEAHAKYLYDLVADRQNIIASFAGGGTAFSTQGFKPARNGADLGGSLTLATKKNIDLSLQYDVDLRENYYDHTGSLDVAYKF